MSDYRKHIDYLLRNYPRLYHGDERLAQRHLFFTGGGGFEWNADGELVDIFEDLRKEKNYSEEELERLNREAYEQDLSSAWDEELGRYASMHSRCYFVRPDGDTGYYIRLGDSCNACRLPANAKPEYVAAVKELVYWALSDACRFSDTESHELALDVAERIAELEALIGFQKAKGK